MNFPDFHPIKPPIATSIAMVASVAIAVAIETPARGFQIFFGEDTVNPQALVNSTAAEADFLSNLVGVGTETFETFTDGQISPLVLGFPGAGNATLLGDGEIQTGNSTGRFPISGSQYWETNSSFSIDFSEEIAAFGFYGTDIGDFNGQITLLLENTLTSFSQLLTINNTIDAPNGSALYYGLIAETGELFNKITFGNTNSGTDFLGFDDMTIGSVAQVDPQSVPEPASVIALMAIGTVGIASALKRKPQR
ncbi:MAG: PEP-CTERM sorting domain-containing protein [Cyanobacteriota bacterium]|nr:PEP-CTERM sorting domain-containing protein [Cyanobacteriota bacterium]